MGAVTAAVIGAGTALYTTNRARRAQADQQDFAREQQEGLDPYGQYRPEAADRLNALSKDPSSIVDTPEYRARMQAASRAVAAQGYSGSGNALVAAAEAGASVYQQAFDNLARLSGADVGVQSRAGVASASIGANANASDNYLSSIAGVGNNIANIATVWGNSRSKFNQPVAASSNYGAFTPTGGVGISGQNNSLITGPYTAFGGP